MIERIKLRISLMKSSICNFIYESKLRVFKGVRVKDVSCLDESFIEWLNKHLRVYLEITEEFIDLNSSELKYKNKKYTLRTIIEEMILISDKLIKYDGYDFMYEEQLSNKLLDLFKVSFNHLWY